MMLCVKFAKKSAQWKFVDTQTMNKRRSEECIWHFSSWTKLTSKLCKHLIHILACRSMYHAQIDQRTGIWLKRLKKTYIFLSFPLAVFMRILNGLHEDVISALKASLKSQKQDLCIISTVHVDEFNLKKMFFIIIEPF